MGVLGCHPAPVTVGLVEQLADHPVLLVELVVDLGDDVHTLVLGRYGLFYVPAHYVAAQVEDVLPELVVVQALQLPLPQLYFEAVYELGLPISQVAQH